MVYQLSSPKKVAPFNNISAIKMKFYHHPEVLLGQWLQEANEGGGFKDVHLVCGRGCSTRPRGGAGGTSARSAGRSRGTRTPWRTTTGWSTGTWSYLPTTGALWILSRRQSKGGNRKILHIDRSKSQTERIMYSSGKIFSKRRTRWKVPPTRWT